MPEQVRLTFKPTRVDHNDREQPPQQASSVPRRSTRDLNGSSLHGSRASSSAKSKDDRALKFVDTESMTASDRLAAYNSTKGRQAQSVGGSKSSKSRATAASPTEAASLVPLLALQVYHLPGNTWCQDWWQYMSNNHPVFGICFHHKLHPIGACTRIVALLGSIIFGLAMANMFYLFYLWNPQFNQVVFTVVSGGEEWTLTTGMLLLWTVGGSLHTMYNLLMWHVAACACCRSGGFCESMACCPSLGKHLLRFFVVMIIALGVLVVLMRVAITNHEEDNDVAEDVVTDSNVHLFEDDEVWKIQTDIDSAQEFQFLLGYFVETILAFFIYYPLGGTLLFSGILGCGCVPLLGGRPSEVATEERKLKKQQLRLNPSGSTMESTGGGDMVDEPTANEQDIELMWTPQAVKEFEGRRRT